MRTPSSHATLGRIIVLSLLLMLFAGSIGLGAVWVRQEISQTANRNKGLERRLDELGRRLDEVATEIAEASSPGALQRQNTAMRLGLGLPREEQVQRVEVSPEQLLALKRPTESVSFGAPRGAFHLAAAAAAR